MCCTGESAHIQPDFSKNHFRTASGNARDFVYCLNRCFIFGHILLHQLITEIVKRLYQSEQMKKQFPDPKERLRHIFEKQVYGLAPTEIIYHIALSYILGFNEDTKDIKHNFRQLDALPYAKEGTLQQKLDELFD